MGHRTLDILRRERVEMPLSTLIDLSVSTKQTEGESAKTILWYRGMLTQYASWFNPTYAAFPTDKAHPV